MTKYYTFKARAEAAANGGKVGFVKGKGYYVIEGNGNPSPFKGKTPPSHVPAPNAPHLSVERLGIIRFCEWGITTGRGLLTYWDVPGEERGELFRCKPYMVPGGTKADCSQFVSTGYEWNGVKGTNDQDATGSLLEKGTQIPLAQAQPGDTVIFGGGSGDHAAFLTEKDGADWWTVGFGHQGAPDRVLLSANEAWFAAHNMPGIRILKFTP